MLQQDGLVRSDLPNMFHNFDLLKHEINEPKCLFLKGIWVHAPKGERMTFKVGANNTFADFVIASLATASPTLKSKSMSKVAPRDVEQGKHAARMPLT
jgi:hypothetical protein